MTSAEIARALRTEGWCVASSIPVAGCLEALHDQARRAWRHDAFKPAGVGRGQGLSLEPKLRGDHIQWIEHDQGSHEVLTCLAWFEELRLVINQECFLGLFDFEAHYARYAPGARYARHVDCFKDSSSRIVSCVLYLNPQWDDEDGGELRLYLPGEAEGHIDVLPRAGTLAVFLSERFPHEVLPAIRERWSIAGWFRTRAPM